MRKIGQTVKHLYNHFDKLLVLFVGIFTIMEGLWFPFNTWLAEILLAMTGQTYLSTSNLLMVLTGNWLATLGLLLLFAVNLLIAYVEVGILFVGAHGILTRNYPTMRAFLQDLGKAVVKIFKGIRPGKVLVVLLYTVVLFPFLRKLLKIDYLNRLVIPQFIIDYLSNQWLLGTVITAALLLFFWWAGRLKYLLPSIYLEGKSAGQAFKSSLARTRREGHLKACVGLFWLVAQFVLAFFAISLTYYGLQVLTDSFLGEAGFVIAILLFTLLKLTYYGLVSLFLLKFVAFSTGSLVNGDESGRKHHLLRLAILSLLVCFFAVEVY